MIHIVVPMGGEGRQFADRGYTFPKPLVEVAGQPLIEIVARNLTPSCAHRFVFVCKQEHIQKFALGDVLELVAPGCRIVTMAKPTAGALCSVLLGMEHLEHEDELLIANADQWIDSPIDAFLSAARSSGWDGAIMTFPNTHPRWSYVRTENDLAVSPAICASASVSEDFGSLADLIAERRSRAASPATLSPASTARIMIATLSQIALPRLSRPGAMTSSPARRRARSTSHSIAMLSRPAAWHSSVRSNLVLPSSRT